MGWGIKMRLWFAGTLVVLMASWQPVAAQTQNPILKANAPVEVCGIWIKPRVYARVVVTETQVCLAAWKTPIQPRWRANCAFRCGKIRR